MDTYIYTCIWWEPVRTMRGDAVCHTRVPPISQQICFERLPLLLCILKYYFYIISVHLALSASLRACLCRYLVLSFSLSLSPVLARLPPLAGRRLPTSSLPETASEPTAATATTATVVGPPVARAEAVLLGLGGVHQAESLVLIPSSSTLVRFVRGSSHPQKTATATATATDRQKNNGGKGKRTTAVNAWSGVESATTNHNHHQTPALLAFSLAPLCFMGRYCCCLATRHDEKTKMYHQLYTYAHTHSPSNTPTPANGGALHDGKKLTTATNHQTSTCFYALTAT